MHKKIANELKIDSPRWEVARMRRFDMNKLCRNNILNFIIKDFMCRLNNTKKKYYLENKALVHATAMDIDTIYNLIFCGKFEIARKYLCILTEWLDEGLEKRNYRENQQFCLPVPAYRAAWMAHWTCGHDEAIVRRYAKLALEHYPGYLERGFEALADDDLPPATPAQQRRALDEFLMDCITAGEYDLGIREFERLATPVNGRKPPMPRLARIARDICEHLQEQRPFDRRFLDKAEKAMARAFPHELEHGHSLHVAKWFKTAYWNTGFAKTPEEALAMGSALLWRISPVEI